MIRRKKKNLIAIMIVTLILLISGIVIMSLTFNKANADDTRYPLCTYNNNSAHPQGKPYRTTSATYLNSNSHAFICAFCGDAAGLTGSHFDDDSDGKCDLCGYTMSTGGGSGHTTHSWTSWTDNGDGTHIRTCTVGGETETASHTYSNGTCTVCGATDPSYTSGECPAGGDHNLGSYQVYYGSSTQHGRICSKCSQWVVIENHNWSEWLDSGDGSHCYRECESNCGVSNQTQSHTIVTLPGRDATCTTSGLTTGSQCTSCHVLLQEQETIPALGHSWNSGTITTAATCTTAGVRTYTCSRCSATKTETIPATGHTGATHSNGGKCTVCGEVYQTHSKGTTIKSYTKTSTTHTPVYACTYSGCTGTFNGTAENHTFGAWTDKGDGSNHTRTCTVCGYEETEAHTGATHPDGKCTKCQTVYQTHSKGTTVKSYTKTSTTHTPVYACTYSGCTGTFNGTAENHTFGAWTDNNDGTTHSRTCTACGEVQTNNHYDDDNDGICDACGHVISTTPTPTPSNPTPTPTDPTPTPTDPTPTPTDPTPTPSNPTPTPSNPTPTPEHTTHDWTPWTDNGDGTHSRECTECDEEETKPHNFENGKCTECGATDPNANNGNSDENCTHPEDKRKWKSDENEHWQECGECGEEIPGTRGKHNYQDGKCKNCGREEKDTTSKTTIPNTGIGTMVFAIVGLMGLVTFGAIKVRKYKDIK